MSIWDGLSLLVVLISAISTGMFTRYVGQLLIDWSKEPSEKLKAAKARRSLLSTLASTIGNAEQYCQQMHGYLSGTAQIVPTFNVDTEVLASLASSVFTNLTEEKAQQVMMARLEIRHVERLVDTLAEMIFLRNNPGQMNPVQGNYLQNAGKIIATTEQRCRDTKQMLENEIASISVERKCNERTLFVLFVIVVSLGAFVFTSSRVLSKTELMFDKSETGSRPEKLIPKKASAEIRRSATDSLTDVREGGGAETQPQAK